MDIETIRNVLEKVLRTILILSSYKLEKCDVQNINNPTKIINYNFTLVSEEYNRWLYIRLQDFYSKQKLTIWINSFHHKHNINIDIESYFISKLYDNGIKQKLVFKASSESDLELHLEKIFKYIVDRSDNNLKNVILGKLWIDMPFDWGDYK